MLETKYVGYNFEMLVTFSHFCHQPPQLRLHYRAPTLKRCHHDRNSVINIRKLSPTISHQHHCHHSETIEHWSLNRGYDADEFRLPLN